MCKCCYIYNLIVLSFRLNLEAVLLYDIYIYLSRYHKLKARELPLFRYSCQHYLLGYLIISIKKANSKIYPMFRYPINHTYILSYTIMDKVSVYCLDPLYLRRF